MLFDTHAHLVDDRFQDDLAETLQRAWAAGVTHVVCVGTTAADSRQCIAVADQFDAVLASVGIQPNNAVDAESGDWDAVVQLASHSRVYAIGETGLDRHWTTTPFAQQEEYFARHLTLARQTSRPVIIHCREAESDVVRMLRAEFDRHGQIRGVMHSFTGDLATAQACVEMGLFVSFAGMVTYPSAGNLRDVAAQLSLDRIVIETDSPYLAPVPLRGKRNEPAFVVHTAACLAGVHGLATDRFAAHATRNARTLFGVS
jgi:TatD DNase family protein